MTRRGTQGRVQRLLCCLQGQLQQTCFPYLADCTNYNFGPSHQSFFKPANLPRFDRKSNLAMFLQLYQNSMYGADKAMKDTTIIKCLDTNKQTLILSSLPENSWTYTNILQALMEEFGSQEALLGQKMDFVDTKLKMGETLEEFTSRFYLEAQTLALMNSVLFIYVQSALLNAVQINREPSLVLKSGIYTAQTVPDLI
ncbi:hypothetical protein DSO57_1028608 [Entomophthora muscae]|uniref:Uncharacterized protein n=1 Tax=Entomophthora muscae TaxID=34485 RepID=A0ACC2SED6_9FUNG|nr:hypothetical protein DSO57_1028608 [Entomophthora muscae]